MIQLVKWLVLCFVLSSLIGCDSVYDAPYYKSFISIDVINESDQSVDIQALSGLVLDGGDQSDLLNFVTPHSSVELVTFDAKQRTNLELDCQHENTWLNENSNQTFAKVESFALKVQIENQVTHYYAGWPEGLEDDAKFEQYGLMYIESPCNSTQRYYQISELQLTNPILKIVITPTYEVVFYIEDSFLP